MASDHWDHLSALFKQAVRLLPHQRTALLDQACADAPELRRELEALLAIDAQTNLTQAFEDDLKAALASWLHPPAIQPGEAVSHYQIQAHLGGGGMGLVYKARDTKLDRLVALKFLPPAWSRSAEAKRRFIQEAKAASALDHPNVCTIYEIDETGAGQLFIAMAYYEGETLKAKLKPGPLPVEEALDYAVQMAEGLSQAHEAGIVHRDVKPANVMVVPTTDGSGSKGRIKLLDFGVAKVQDADLTRTGATVGTPAYMSPEQARGEPVDARTDLWSLGVVLYEMLTGQRPFLGDYEQAVIYSILHEEPEPVQALRPEVPEGLTRVVQQTLVKHAADRCAGMPGLLLALHAVQRGQHVAPRKLRATDPSIAVLPFADMSPQRDQDYFCEGVAEEILNALTRIDGLRVASRTSAFTFKGKHVDIRQIGRQLGVETVLEGGVRKAGDRLRITVQLINASDGYHLWSERYDREIEDVFAIQDEIAEHSVRALRGVLTERDRQALQKAPTADIEAYDYYLQGRQFIHQVRRADLDHARRLFNRAIEIDPGYAPAYAALSFCSYYLYEWCGHAEADLREAARASRKAVELAPELAEPHVARGLALALSERFKEAEEAMDTALRLNPSLYEANYFYARIYFVQGKLERAAELFKRAAQVDLQEYQASILLGLVFQGLGRMEESRKHHLSGLVRAERRLELNPNEVRALNMGAIALLRIGERERGLAWQRRALELDPDDPIVVWNAACSYAIVGENEQALVALEKAIALGIANRSWLEHDPDMNPLRDHVRFQELLQSMP